MKVTKYKRGQKDGAYGSDKNRNITWSQNQSKWVIPKAMNFNIWPEMCMAYLTNQVNCNITLTGLAEPDDTTTKGQLYQWPYDGPSQWATPSTTRLQAAFVGQPMNLPTIIYDTESAPTDNSGGAGTRITFPFGGYNRPDFLHNMLLHLPYLKQFNQSGGAGAAGNVLQHNFFTDIGMNRPETPAAAYAAGSQVPNNRFLRCSGALRDSTDDVSFPISPYYQSMWISVVKFTISYTVHVRGYMVYDEPAAWTAGTWQGKAQMPISNALRIGFTPFKAMPKTPSGQLQQEYTYDRKRYTSWNGTMFQIDTDFEKGHNETSVAYASELNSPFPTSFGEFWGGITDHDNSTEKQDSKGTHGPMFKKDYLLKGNTTFSDTITGKIVPHEFLGLSNVTGDGLQYKDLAFGTNTDFNMIMMDSLTDKRHLREAYMFPALTSLKFAKDGASGAVDADDSMIFRAWKEKMAHVIGSTLQASTKFELQKGTKITIDANVQFERTAHYFHEGDNSQYYSPGAPGTTAEAVLAMDQSSWTAGDTTTGLNAIPAAELRLPWPENMYGDMD